MRTNLRTKADEVPETPFFWAFGQHGVVRILSPRFFNFMGFGVIRPRSLGKKETFLLLRDWSEVHLNAYRILFMIPRATPWRREWMIKIGM